MQLLKAKHDSQVILELDKFEVVTVDEYELRLFLAQRAINCALVHGEDLGVDVIEYVINTEDLQSAFATAVETDYMEDARAAYDAFKLWKRRILTDSFAYS